MTVLTADRNTPERSGSEFTLPLSNDAVVFAGGMVQVDSSENVSAAGVAGGRRAVGVARESMDNTGGINGDLSVRVRRGVFRFANDAASIALGDIGKECFVVDDQTVNLNDNVGARIVAGRIVDVDDQGVWVDVGGGGASNLRKSAALNFGSIAAAAQADLTIAVPGAIIGNPVALGLPAAPTAGIIFMAFVSADGTVTVRATNITAAPVDPASATYNVTVVRS